MSGEPCIYEFERFLQPSKVGIEHKETRTGSPQVAVQERRAARTGLGQDKEIGAPGVVRWHLAFPAVAQRRHRSHTDNIRKSKKWQRKLSADAKSSKRKANLSREVGEQEEHHKLPHDIASKCSQAKKEKMKAKDILTKHGALVIPPAKNVMPNGCEDNANSTTSVP